MEIATEVPQRFKLTYDSTCQQSYKSEILFVSRAGLQQCLLTSVWYVVYIAIFAKLSFVSVCSSLLCTVLILLCRAAFLKLFFLPQSNP